MENGFFQNNKFFKIPGESNELYLKLLDYFNNLEITQDKIKEFLKNESDKKYNGKINEDLLKEIYHKLGKIEICPENQDNLINIFLSILTDILSSENKIEKNEFYTNRLDLKLNNKINKFGDSNTLRYIGLKIIKSKEKKLNIKKFKIINEIINIYNPDSFEIKNNLIQKFEENLNEIKSLENEIYLLKDNIKDFKKIIENYEKGDIDISAIILNYPKNDQEKLKKLLFTMKNKKDFVININEIYIFNLIEVSILKNFFYKNIKVMNKFLENLPQIIYFKYISVNNKRFWSNYKLNNNFSKRRENWVEYYLKNTNDFIKFSEFNNNELSIRISKKTLNYLSKIFINTDYKLIEEHRKKNESFKIFYQNFEDYCSIKENINVKNTYSLKSFLLIYKEFFDKFEKSIKKENKNFNYWEIFNIDINKILFKNKINNTYNVYEDIFNDKFESNYLYFNNYFKKKFIKYSDYFNYCNIDNIKQINKLSDLEKYIDLKQEILNKDDEININNKMKKILYKSYWLKSYPCFYFPKINKRELLEKPNLYKSSNHNYIINWVKNLLETDFESVNEEIKIKIKKFFYNKDINDNKIYSMSEKIFLNCYQMIFTESRKYLILIQTYCNFYRSLQKNINMMNYYINNLNEDNIKDNVNESFEEEQSSEKFELNLSKLFLNEKYDYLDNTNPMKTHFYNPKIELKNKNINKEPFKDKYTFINFENKNKNKKEFLKINSLIDSEIIYEAGLYDFTNHLKYLNDILICFIENNLIEYNADFKDLYEDNDNIFTNQNLLINISKIPEIINYEYLFLKLLKVDQKYNYYKCKILFKFNKILNKIYNSKYYIKFSEFIFDFMIKKPEITYKQRKLSINNFINYLKGKENFKSKNFKKNIVIYLNTIYDNYKASIINMKKYYQLVKNMIKNFKNNYKKFKEELDIEKINFELDYSYLVKVILNIEEKKKFINNNLMIDDNLGEMNFTEFIFEKYWNNKLQNKIKSFDKNDEIKIDNFDSINENLNFIKYYIDLNSFTLTSFKNIWLDILINEEIEFFLDQIFIDYSFTYDMQEIINNQKKIKGSIIKMMENFKIIKNKELENNKKELINEENSFDKFNKINRIIYIYYIQELRNEIELNLNYCDLNILCMNYQQKIYNQSKMKKFSFSFENKEKKAYVKINLNIENIFKTLLKCEHYGFHNIFELFKNDLFEITLFKEESKNNFLQFIKYTSDYLIYINYFIELILNNNTFNHLIFFNQLVSQLRKNLCSENLINSYITQLNFANNNLNNANNNSKDFLINISNYNSVVYEKILLDFFDHKITDVLYDPIYFSKDLLNIIHNNFKEEKLSLYYDKNKYKNIKTNEHIINKIPEFTIINSNINKEYKEFKNIEYKDIKKTIILKLRRINLYLNMMYESNFENRRIHKFFKLINFNQDQIFKISLIDELNLSNIKNTIINILTNNLINDKYKLNKKKNEEVLNNYDEIINIIDTPNVLKFRNIYNQDINRLLLKSVEAFELNFIKPIYFISIDKKNVFKRKDDNKVTHNKKFNFKEKSQKSLNFFENYIEQIIYHINKYYYNNIFQVNKSSNNNIELEKILNNLKDIKFKINNLNNDFPDDYGFNQIYNINYNKVESNDIFLEKNDIETPYFLNDLILFNYCFNLKYVISFFNLIFYQNSLELNNEDFFCLYNMEIPFYILGHLKIKEIENEFSEKDYKMRNLNEDILYKNKDFLSKKDKEILLEYEEFQNSNKIRYYICDIKKLELKFLNQFKEINKFFEEINKNMIKIKENPKILKPKNVFNSLLKYTNDNLQKIIILANLDILFKIRWNNITKDIVDIAKGLENTNNFKNIRNIFLEVMFPDLNKTMNKNYKKKFIKNFSKKNFSNCSYDKIKKIIKSNKILKIMINWNNKKLKKKNKYDLYNFYNQKMDWEFIFLNNINLTCKEKSIINNKIFEIKINLDIANTCIQKNKNSSIIENSIFLNQILNLNIKNIVLLEILVMIGNSINNNYMKGIFNDIVDLNDNNKENKYDLNILKNIINSKIINFDFEKNNNYSILNFKELIQKYKDTNIFKKLFKSDEELNNLLSKINISDNSTIINIINEEIEFIENKKIKNFNEHKEILIKTVSWNLKNSFLNFELTTNNYLIFFLAKELFINLLNYELKIHLKNYNNINNKKIIFKKDFNYLENFLDNFVNYSYFVESNNKKRWFAISKKDFINIIIKLNEFNNYEDEEIFGNQFDYQITKINNNIKKKEWIKFYLELLIINFKKNLNSQIGLKNLNFIEEIECLNNSLKLQTYDNKYLFKKLSIVFKYKFNLELNDWEKNYNFVNDKLREFKNRVKSDVAKIIDKGKNDGLKILKNKYEEIFSENYPINNKKNSTFITELNETIRLNIKTDNGEDEINLAIKRAIDNCVKLKVFYCFKKYKNMRNIKKKLKNLKEKSEDCEVWNKLIQEKEKDEQNLKNEFKIIQKKIAKLEIENNILRKDLNKNEFEKIDLMKIVNIKRSKIEELQWNEQVKLVNKNNKTNYLNINIDISKGIKNCLLVESNLLTKKIINENKANYLLEAENVIDEEKLAQNFEEKIEKIVVKNRPKKLKKIESKDESKKIEKDDKKEPSNQIKIKPLSSKTRISSALRTFSKIKK